MGYDRVRYVRLEGRRDEVLSSVKSMLLAHKQVKLALVFGSSLERDVARDVDLAIYACPRLSFEELLRLGTKLELAAKVPVDLVQLQDLNPSFRLKILLKGLPLVVRSELLYHRLVAAAFSELEDFKRAVEIAKGLALEQD